MEVQRNHHTMYENVCRLFQNIHKLINWNNGNQIPKPKQHKNRFQFIMIMRVCMEI